MRLPPSQFFALAVALVALGLTVAGCGSDDLSADDARATIDELPFEVTYEDVDYDGDGEIVAGQATNGRSSVHFELALGGADPDFDGSAFSDDGPQVDRRSTDGYVITFGEEQPRNGSPALAELTEGIDSALCRSVESDPDCVN